MIASRSVSIWTSNEKSHRNVFSVAFSLSVRRLRKGVCGTGGLARLNRAGGSSCPGGKFFAEPQRRFAVPTAVGKRVDTCGFYPLNSRFPLFLSLAQTRDRRPLRNRGTAEDFFYRRGAQCAPMSRAIRSAGYHTAAQTVYAAQARHICAAQLVYALLWTATTSFI